VGTLRTRILIIKIVDLRFIGKLGAKSGVSTAGEKHRVRIDGIHATPLLLLLPLTSLFPLGAAAAALHLRNYGREFIQGLIQGICFSLHTGGLVNEIPIVKRAKRSHSTALRKQLTVERHGCTGTATPLASPALLPLLPLLPLLSLFTTLLPLSLASLFTTLNAHSILHYDFMARSFCQSNRFTLSFKSGSQAGQGHRSGSLKKNEMRGLLLNCCISEKGGPATVCFPVTPHKPHRDVFHGRPSLKHLGRITVCW
jgi:hypothetical protein